MALERIMKKLKFVILIIAFIASPSWADRDNGFQGLAWGSSVLSIKNKYPEARQESPSTTKYPICKNSDGTTYECTIAQQMCVRLGMLCYPSLLVNNYMVGSYPFDLAFELSKKNTLSGVSLTYSGDLAGKNKEKGRHIFQAVNKKC